jgi:hypothetical protein
MCTDKWQLSNLHVRKGKTGGGRGHAYLLVLKVRRVPVPAKVFAASLVAGFRLEKEGFAHICPNLSTTTTTTTQYMQRL